MKMTTPIRFCWFAVFLAASFLCTATGASQEKGADSTTDSKLYKVETGEFKVNVFDRLMLDDEGRDKPLQIRVTYPQTSDSEKLPVIIFSHGAGGSKKTYEPLIKHWVSHGYVCIQATHGDSVALLKPRELREYRSLKDYVSNGMLAKHQLTRPVEIKLILDRFDEIEGAIKALDGKLDRDRIGMGGHSFGAHTTQMIGGLSIREIPGKKRITTKDDRPKALLMISPQGTGGQIDEKSWQDIERPTMVITGTKDRGRNGQSYEWRLEVYENLPAHEKYLAFVNDATHNFGGISGTRFPGSGQRNENHVNYVKTSTIAFWDAYLMDNPDALKFLQSDQLAKATQDEAKLTSEIKKSP